MKAVLQNFKNGKLDVSEIPPPAVRPGGVLVQNVTSLVSAGTEKAMMELAKMNPLQKAKARPDLVKKVLSKMSQDGLIGTAKTVLNLISNPIPLGYSCAGIVKAVGEGVSDIRTGDRVACAGLGHANHAEVVFVPRNLATPIPNGVNFESAAFVTVGAIAMQGVRQADLRVGENVVVIGLGLVGQLVAQIASASGCRVFGIDLDPAKVKLSQSLGAHGGAVLGEGDAEKTVSQFTGGRGADAVLITAATKSNEPIELAPKIARDRGCVVVVGEVGFDVPRRAYYEKEIDLKLSRSYGPGRYDAQYEEKGQDYPIGYVRWTENRNMETFLDLVSQEKVKLEPLVTHSYAIEDAHEAYQLLSGKKSESYIGILLQYNHTKEMPSTVSVQTNRFQAHGDALRFGVIGAGQFAQGILLPRLAKIAGVQIEAIATGSGITAKTIAEKYGAQLCTSDYKEILSRNDFEAVLIATRHHLHAEMVRAALLNGKHVFVEKPLAIHEEELTYVRKVIRDLEAGGKTLPILTVGYNRRFSLLSRKLKAAFSGNPLTIQYRVNAGAVAKEHWTQDPKVGGGRIVGEICHFVDLLQFLTSSKPVEVFAQSSSESSAAIADPDNLSIQIRFSDGSIGNVIYVANGDPSFPKERIEAFGGGVAGVIDNWRKLEISRNGGKDKANMLLGAEKGFTEELRAFVRAIRKGEPAISLESLFLTTQTTFAIQQSHRTGEVVPVVLASLNKDGDRS